MGDGREKHPVCPICRELKIPTTYWCDVNCPGNPGAWKRHTPVHKEVRRLRERSEDGGWDRQQDGELAEVAARQAAQTGDAYMELMAKGMRYASRQDPRREVKAYREAIALKPDEPLAYYHLGMALAKSGHFVESAQRYLEAKERRPVGSKFWGSDTAAAFNMLTHEACAEVAKPEWWNDEGLNALSARVVRAAPDSVHAHQMRALVLRGHCDAWEAGPRSAEQLREAATHFERAGALHHAPAIKAKMEENADACRRAEGMLADLGLRHTPPSGRR